MKNPPDELHPLEREGKEHYAAKKYIQAAESFSRAAVEFNQQGKDLLAAEMRNNQAVSLLLAKEAQQALNAVLGTADVFMKAGDQQKQAMALANEASALKDLGKKGEAIAKFSEAAALFEHLDQSDQYLQIMQSISALKLRSRNIIGALFSMQQGLDALNKPSLGQKILLWLLKIPQRLLEK